MNTTKTQVAARIGIVSAVVLGSGLLMGAGIVPAEAKPLPQEVYNVLDTLKLWMGIIAGSLAIIALILVGIGMFFARSRGDGGEMLQKLGWWIAGVTLIATASGLVAVFLPAAAPSAMDAAFTYVGS